VPQEVIDEIGRLDASEVVIIGSPTAVTFSVENDLRQSGVSIVRRLGGSDAYGTSAAVAQEMVTRGLTVTGDGGKLVNVAVVGGLNLKTQSPYDAMVAAPVAAHQDMPLLLVKKASVPVAVADFLAANESTETNVLLVGGESIVSADVEPQLTPADPASANEDYVSPVVRVSGADRYATSVAVAKLAMEGYGFSGRKAALSTLNSAPEVLALSPVLANRNEPVILTAPILKRKAVADSPGAYTWMSPVTEVFISKQTAPTLDPSGELANANIAVLDSIGRVNTDVWNYALKEAGIK
jgi:hypothetical protein